MDVRYPNTPLYLTLLFTLISGAHANENSENLCGGHTDFLNFINRPTNIDSACVVPDKASDLELGMRYQGLTPNGNQITFPQSVFRYGLADRFEVGVRLPNYQHQNVAPKAGFSATTMNLKHELFANKTWVGALEGLITFPSGSYGFGSYGTGAIVQGLIAHNFTDEIAVTAALAYSSQSEPLLSGGLNYKSINPDAVVTWTKDKISLFVEVYGQSKTAPDQGSGFNSDAGFLYLLQKNVIVDCSVGHRINGALGGFNSYVGAGISFQLS